MKTNCNIHIYIYTKYVSIKSSWSDNCVDGENIFYGL